MVCLVKDNAGGKYIPSCSSIVSGGMDIDASSAGVVAMRQEAVRMLLTEHRAECEAPCRLVCPGLLNIPLMNRLLAAGKSEEAAAMTFGALGDPLKVCGDCAGYCDKACRRKRIDSGLANRAIVMLLASSYPQLAGENREINPVPPKDQRPFNSTLGKVQEEEWQEWLKESRDGAAAFTDPQSVSEAAEEASRCMHCDCRAAADCRLRDVTTELRVKNPRNKTTSVPIEKKINQHSGLVFEHAKCIKCGLCVRLGEGLAGVPALSFRGRGFNTVLSEPLGYTFVETTESHPERFAEICPTGALMLAAERSAR